MLMLMHTLVFGSKMKAGLEKQLYIWTTLHNAPGDKTADAQFCSVALTSKSTFSPSGILGGIRFGMINGLKKEKKKKEMILS